MIEKTPAPDCPDEVVEACKAFRQGHLIEKPSLFYWANLAYPIWDLSRKVAEAATAGDETDPIVEIHPDDRPEYGLITTQSCDLLRPDQQPWFQVAPVFNCADGDDIFDLEFIVKLDPPALATTGAWYADLRLEMPLEKGILVGRRPIDSYRTEADYIRLADILARRVGRPALHNVFNHLLNGIAKEMKRDGNKWKKQLRRIRKEIYKLRLSIEEGERLDPAAAKLYIVTQDEPSEEAKEWFDEWWNRAREAAEDDGLELLPNGWLDASSLDVTHYDDLIEVHSATILGS